MTSHTLLVPYLNDDPVYAYGVELGLLLGRMQAKDATEIADFFCRRNQEQILLTANRLGWSVGKIEAHDRDWFWCELTKQLTPIAE